jgi:RHS repeat-associated protein
LGSTRVVLTADGSLYDRNEYEPFGTILRSGGGQYSSDRLSYIGKEKDSESDLGDFGVRKYEAETGRFLSVDPLWEEQRPWNVYHYSANNPIVAKDPDGKLGIFALLLTIAGEFFSQTQVANSPRNSYEAKHGQKIGERMIQQAADATAVAAAPIMIKGAAKHTLKESVEVLGEVGSRGKAVSIAKNHASVPSPRKGGEHIPLDKVKESSRGKNWNKMKENGATSIGAKKKGSEKGKSEWMDHPDGHPDAGKPGVPKYHGQGHIHSANSKGQQIIIPYKAHK